MALCDVHELSSILRTEDLEKSELNRKKLSIELAIKQQEGRLQYEVDERERCVREIYTAHDGLADTLSHLELKELTLHELQVGIEAECTTASRDLLKQLGTGAESLFAAFENLSRKFDEAIKKTVEVEQNQAKGNLETNVRNKQRLRVLENAVIAATQRASHALEAKQTKDAELVELDIQTADVTSEIENNEACLGAANRDFLSRHEETECQHQSIASHKAENAREDFKYSAELGKRAQTITTQKDKIAEETKTAAALEEETAKLAKIVQAAVERGQIVSKQISTAQQDLDRSRSEARDLHSTRAALQQNQASMTSDLAAMSHLRQTIALQSFKPRADQLAEELREVNTCNQRLEAEMKLLQGQLDDNSQHGELRCLQERLRTAGVAHNSAHERRGLLGEEVTSVLHTQCVALQEKAELERYATSLVSKGLQVEQQLKSVQQDVNHLTMALREEQSCADLENHLQQEHEQALADQARCVALTTEIRASNEKSAAELEGLRHAATERDQAATARALGKEKQRRLSAAKEAAASAHRQTVAKLRRALMEEDKLFQQTQQRERADHDAAMNELAKEKSSLDVLLVQKQAELAALQQELRETAEVPLLPLPFTATPLLSVTPSSILPSALVSELDARPVSVMAQATQPTQAGTHPVQTAPSSQTRAAQERTAAPENRTNLNPEKAVVPGATPAGSKKRAKPSATAREKETENEAAAPKPPKTRAGSSKKRKL